MERDRFMSLRHNGHYHSGNSSQLNDMVQALTKPITITDFLQLPETQPASEYIAGTIIQKPMPKGKHALLLGKWDTNGVADRPQ